MSSLVQYSPTYPLAHLATSLMLLILSQMLLAKRNRMMQYLMVTDIKEFGRVIDSLNLVKEAKHLRRA